ncbi:MAG: ptpA 2 [Verrucomicrobiales bacterium]|nr:ptpA 2 [Verrucomicrobiales bacterium]
MKKFICHALLLLAFPMAGFAQGTRSDYARASSLKARTDNKVFRTDVQANWLPDGKRFWYRVETGPGQHEMVLVDAGAGTREVVKDLSGLPEAPVVKSSTRRLRMGRTRRTGPSALLTIVNATGAEVEAFWVDSEGKFQSYGKIAPRGEMVQHTFAGHHWVVKDPAGQPFAAFTAAPGSMRMEIDGPPSGDAADDGGGGPPRGPDGRGMVSPDGKWRVELKDHNLFLNGDGLTEPVPLTTDGTAAESYRPEVTWSPDSGALVATRVQPGQEHPVHIVESSPEDGGQPKLFTHNYLKPGDKLPRPRPVLVEVATRKAALIDQSLFPEFFEPDGDLQYRWQPDSRSFTFSYNQRGHQVFRVISVNRENGAARAVVDETSPTFIDYNEKTWHRFMDKTGELVWMSERDGWCQLYLYDVASGNVKNRITDGKWVVRRVERLDEEARTVWFFASGLRAGEDPYHEHLCRVNLDGSGFVRLTEGDGTHQVKFSPDRQWFVDRWSRADLPEVTELRRASDGGLVLELERGDWRALLAEGWRAPERFVARGRDGVTGIHGTIVTPSNFDPAKTYPILEEVYAGPQGAFAAKEFTVAARQHALAELGFVVVQSDGMGTNHRGKKFHEVCWKNLADAGFPDRISWIRAAAADRPWMDLKRVGIYGGSAGGQNAMRALIDHGDFYSAAAADCGCHDNRMDKIWWNEQWMGWPVDESYARSSNVDGASRMQGKLLLTVGEMDSNVDPASTMQVVNALVKADKDFEMLVLPGKNHGAGESPYGVRKRMDFFVRALLGREPRWLP